MNPGEAIALRDARAAKLADHVITAPEHAFGPQNLNRGSKRPRLRHGGGIHDDVVEIDEVMQAFAGMAVIKRPRDMREDELAARVTTAQTSKRLHIPRIGDAIGEHDVQHHDAIVIMAGLPHPLRRKGFDLRLLRVRHIGIKAIRLDANKHARAHQPPHFCGVIGRRREHKRPRVRAHVDLRLHPRVLAHAIIPHARIAKEQSLDYATRHPKLHCCLKIRHAVAAIFIEENGTLSFGKMAAVKQVRVRIEDLRRHEAVDGAMQQLAVGVVEFGDEVEGHENQSLRYTA